MKSVCEEKLDELRETVSRQYGDAGHNSFDRVYAGGRYDTLLMIHGVDKEFKDEVEKFLYRLYCNDFDKLPAYRKISLHESNFVDIFNRYSYELSLFIGNKDAYRYLPRFVKGCIDRFKLSNYQHLSYNDILERLNKYMDISRSYDYNNKREIFTIVPRYPDNCFDWSKYEDKIENDTLDLTDKYELAVWAEKQTYKFEEAYTGKAEWVSRNHGDGYGYDILSYDATNYKQKLIEVKSTSTQNNISLSLKEYETMINIDNDTCDYYVYVVRRNGINDELKCDVLRYDNMHDRLINIKTGEEYYTSPNIYYDEKKKQIIEFIIEPKEEYKKSLYK